MTVLLTSQTHILSRNVKHSPVCQKKQARHQIVMCIFLGLILTIIFIINNNSRFINWLNQNGEQPELHFPTGDVLKLLVLSQSKSQRYSVYYE